MKPPPLKLRALPRAFVLAALLLLVLPRAASAYSYYEPCKEHIASTQGSFSVELWHHIGGYWTMGRNHPKYIEIRDRDIEIAGIRGWLSANQSAKWTLPLPDPVKKAIARGAKVTAEAEENKWLYTDPVCVINGESSVSVFAVPIFRLSTTATLNSYVRGIDVTIPLVSAGSGRNLYAIYGWGSFGARGLGKYSDMQPSTVFSPFIHPSQITNCLGRLDPDTKINIEGRTVSAAGYSVGFLTLEKGGAVGLQFEFPVKVNFYEEQKRLVTVPDPPADEPSEIPGSTPSDNSGSEPSENNAPQPADSQQPGSSSGTQQPNTPSIPGASEPPSVPLFDIRAHLLHRKY